MKLTPNRLAHILSGADTERNVGTAAIGYLQQLLPSQQAGVPQQVATVAARADNERTSGCRKCEYECFEFHNDLLGTWCLIHMRAMRVFDALALGGCRARS